jgi:RNA polymerase sigma-70 factor (ECF subfamily)
VIGRRGADLAELEALYRSRFDAFARVAASVAGEGTRDAVQEAFATAVRKRRSFRGDGPLEAWVWRIVLNAARDEARRRRPTQEQVAGCYLNEKAPADPEVRAAVAGLPERQRLAVYLRYYADLDYDAIATALEVKPGTVAATLNAAHARLRGRLEEART